MMQTVKTVVTGPFDAGKTQFICSVSEIDVVPAESKSGGERDRVREETAVAMGFGRITIDDNLVLYLFGSPGQRRSDCMWEILSEGMLGFVILVDSARPEAFREARHILHGFRNYAPTAYVVAANKQDVDESWPPEHLRIALKIDRGVRVLPCVATDKQDVKQVILELVYSMLETMDRKGVQ